MQKTIIDAALMIVADSGRRALVRGARAGLAGLVDSVLGDLEGVTETVSARTKSAREKLERIPR